ncbi:hypothetical protein BLOT_004245 [Blomia tropicalis]|nr:hypothetical protein BLOT_004245 [Blomia tropicalis]
MPSNQESLGEHKKKYQSNSKPEMDEISINDENDQRHREWGSESYYKLKTTNQLRKETTQQHNKSLYCNISK